MRSALRDACGRDAKLNPELARWDAFPQRNSRVNEGLSKKRTEWTTEGHGGKARPQPTRITGSNSKRTTDMSVVFGKDKNHGLDGTEVRRSCAEL